MIAAVFSFVLFWLVWRFFFFLPLLLPTKQVKHALNVSFLLFSYVVVLPGNNQHKQTLSFYLVAIWMQHNQRKTQPANDNKETNNMINTNEQQKRVIMMQRTIR